MLKLNPEWRVWTDRSGRSFCPGQLFGNGFPLGWLQAAQRPFLSLSVICLPRGSAFSQLAALGLCALESSYSSHLGDLSKVGCLRLGFIYLFIYLGASSMARCAFVHSPSPNITNGWLWSTHREEESKPLKRPRSHWGQDSVQAPSLPQTGKQRAQQGCLAWALAEAS